MKLWNVLFIVHLLYDVLVLLGLQLLFELVLGLLHVRNVGLLRQWHGGAQAAFAARHLVRKHAVVVAQNWRKGVLAFIDLAVILCDVGIIWLTGRFVCEEWWDDHTMLVMLVLVITAKDHSRRRLARAVDLLPKTLVFSSAVEAILNSIG